jgi:hypothetical protein
VIKIEVCGRIRETVINLKEITSPSCEMSGLGTNQNCKESSWLMLQAAVTDFWNNIIKWLLSISSPCSYQKSADPKNIYRNKTILKSE